jgi:predicted transglutaminase-like cysteine proteinase
LIKPKAAAAAAAAATASSAGAPAAAAGGTEQELAQQSAEQGQDMLPAGMNEDGVIEDMQAYDAWLADEQTQRDMQRREEVNINHSHRHDEQDDVEIGGTSDDVDWPVKSAGSAGNYYTEKDNYYVIGSMDERWQGKGAEALGIEGKVDKALFTELLQGSCRMAAT